MNHISHAQDYQQQEPGGGAGTMTPTYCNNNVDCTIKNTSFTRLGFGYKGWFTATAGGTKYGATTKINKDTDIYAQWSACVAGTYSTNNNCSNCPANSYSDGASNASCTACPAGMISAASSKSKTACKVTCAAGKYLAKNTSTCAACPVGSYCGGGTYYFNASADQGKTACPSGMTSAASSSVKTACKITCAAGKYLAANGTSCSNCPAGKYCKGGTYNFNTSANQGITGNCNANTYSTGSAGAASCTACPSGMTSAAGSTAKTACKITCAAGKYLPANGTSCANCPANNYCLGGTFN